MTKHNLKVIDLLNEGLLLYQGSDNMNEEDVVVGLDMLTDLELVDLYNNVLEHIKFLNSSILELESEGTKDE